MKTHKDLQVYKKSIEFVELVYEITSTFPKEEKYSLSAQLKRAAISVPSNIAEGAARKGTREFIHFLYISLSSLSEIDTQIEIAYRLKYLNNPSSIANRIVYIKTMIIKLINKLEQKLM